MTAPRTPEFRRWFRASKIVDANGEPLVVYHGGFDVLNSRAGAFRRSASGALGAGIYFTPDRSVAEYYAGSQGGHAETGGGALTEVYLSIQNPLVVDHTRGYDPAIEALVLLGEPRARAEAKVERARERSGDVGKTIETAAVKADYDGIIHSIDGEVYEIVAFQPGQVKSATRNAGTYEFFDPDIRRNPASGLDVRPGIPGTYRTTFTDKGGRERAYPAQGGAAWDNTLVRVANETTVESGRVYDTVKQAEHAGHASLRGKRGEVAVTRLTNPYFGNGLLHDDDVFLDLLAIWKRGVSPDVKPYRLRNYTEQQTKKFYERYGSGILNDAEEYETAVADWARTYPPRALAPVAAPVPATPYDALHAAAGSALRAWMDTHRNKQRVQEAIKHARRMATDADYLLGVNASRFAQDYAAMRPHMIGPGREGQQYRALMEGALILRTGKRTAPGFAATRREVERLLSVMRGEGRG